MTEPQENLYNMWQEEDRFEKKSLRASIAVAVFIHLVLLAVTFPTVTQELDFEKPEAKVFVMTTPRFERQPPPPTRAPPRTVRKVAMPDETPHEPEVPRFESIEPSFEVAQVNAGLVLGIPDAPPEPLSEEPQSDEPIFVGGQVAPPERVHYVEPRYPEIARVTRTHGIAIVQATVDKQGDVVDVKIIKDLAMGLGDAAAEAVAQWKFEPATLNGKPVAVYYSLTVRFALH